MSVTFNSICFHQGVLVAFLYNYFHLISEMLDQKHTCLQSYFQSHMFRVIYESFSCVQTVRGKQNRIHPCHGPATGLAASQHTTSGTSQVHKQVFGKKKLMTNVLFLCPENDQDTITNLQRNGGWQKVLLQTGLILCTINLNFYF